MPNTYRAKKVYTQSSVFDSRFEYSLHQAFEGLKHHPDKKLSYVIPHKYTADFLTPTGHFIECKGYLSPEDRAKYKHLKEQNPNVSIVFVFSKPTETISKASRTTYRQWANKLGFENYTIDNFPGEKFGLTKKEYKRS